MKSKFNIFVLYAILGCSYSVQSSTPIHLLLEKVWNGISELEDNREVSTLIRYAAHVPLYDMLMKLVIEYLYNLEAKPPLDNSAAILAEVTLNEKIAIDYILNAIPFALGKSCEGIETTRTAIHAYADEIYAGVADVIELTVTGNYYENQAKIETYKSGLKSLLGGLIGELFNLLRSCLNTTNADTLAAIKTIEDRSTTYINLSGISVFNALRYFGVAVASGNKNLSLISDIEECKVKTLTALREEINYESALLEALYINSCFDRTLLVSSLAVSQYASIAKAYNFQVVVETVFDEIINRANRIRIGIDDDVEEVFSRIVVAQAKVTVISADDVDLFLEAILLIHPENLSVLTKARNTLIQLTTRIGTNYFLMIEIALNKSETYSKIVADVNNIKNEINSLAQIFIQNCIKLLRNDKTFSEDIENEIANIQQEAVTAFGNHVTSIQKGVLILAQAIHGNGIISAEDISAIEAAEANGSSARRIYGKLLSQACLILLVN